MAQRVLYFLFSTVLIVTGFVVKEKGIDIMLRLFSVSKTIRPLLVSRPLYRSLAISGSKANSNDDIRASMPSHWSEVILNDREKKTPRNKQPTEMDERIKAAKEWVSLQLSDEDAKLLDEKLGIKDVLSKKKNRDEDNRNVNHKNSRSKLNVTISEDQVKLKDLKGFLQLNPFICSGCGTQFQTKDEEKPGFLRKDKFAEHHEHAEVIRKQQEAIKILEMAGIELDSPSAEEYLLSANFPDSVIKGVQRIGMELNKAAKARSLPKEAPNDLTPFVSTATTIDEYDELATNDTESERTALDPRLCVCQRCYRLQQYGKVESALRPGWSQHELLTPERFESLLSGIAKMKTVVLNLVDIFDLDGSILPNLRTIAGNNPVIVAVNKVDLLPTDVSELRLHKMIYDQLIKKCGFYTPHDYTERYPHHRHEIIAATGGHGVLPKHNVVLLSCQAGYGMEKLMNTVHGLAKEHGNSIHVIGAANAGKSSFINRLIEPKPSTTNNNRKRSSSSASSSPKVTVSNLPGTTLDFLKIKLPTGLTVVDTPGLINKGHITTKLTTEELRDVLPTKVLKPVTFRLEEGRSILLGGLARVELTQVRFIPLFLVLLYFNEIAPRCRDDPCSSQYSSLPM